MPCNGVAVLDAVLVPDIEGELTDHADVKNKFMAFLKQKLNIDSKLNRYGDVEFHVDGVRYSAGYYAGRWQAGGDGPKVKEVNQLFSKFLRLYAGQKKADKFETALRQRGIKIKKVSVNKKTQARTITVRI